jgi:hypothetical protein
MLTAVFSRAVLPALRLTALFNFKFYLKNILYPLEFLYYPISNYPLNLTASPLFSFLLGHQCSGPTTQ